jgi:hypothetical protein
MKQALRITSHAFTLIEAVICVALVGMMMAAAFKVMGVVAINQRIDAEQRIGYLLAEQLMSEILACSYEEKGTTNSFGLETGEVLTQRATFDDVDDFDKYVEDVARDQNDAVMTEYSGWIRKVKVDWSLLSAPSQRPATITASPIKFIKITVFSPTKKEYDLVAVRYQKGARERQPVKQSIYVTESALQLKIGASSKPVRTTAHPLNGTVQ